MARREKRKRNGWKALAIVLTVVLVLGVGIFFTKDYVVAKAEIHLFLSVRDKKGKIRGHFMKFREICWK